MIAPDEVQNKNRLPHFIYDGVADNLTTDITPEEIKIALQTVQKGMVTGSDGISYEIVKNLPDKYYTILAKAYTHILKQNAIPNSWRQYYFIPIQKPGTTGFQVQDFRPIILTNTVRKIYEKILTQ